MNEYQNVPFLVLLSNGRGEGEAHEIHQFLLTKIVDIRSTFCQRA